MRHHAINPALWDTPVRGVVFVHSRRQGKSVINPLLGMSPRVRRFYVCYANSQGRTPMEQLQQDFRISRAEHMAPFIEWNEWQRRRFHNQRKSSIEDRENPSAELGDEYLLWLEAEHPADEP